LYSPGPVACFSDEDDASGNQNNCYWPCIANQLRYESEFLQKLVKDKKMHETRAFNFTYRYIDDVLSINNSRFAEFRQICYRWGTPAYWSLVPRSSMFYLFEFCLKNMWNCSLTQQILRHSFYDWRLCELFLLNFTYRFIDDVISINNSRFAENFFHWYILQSWS
jgi:hypothetical protein